MKILTTKLRSNLSIKSQYKRCFGWGFLASVIVPFVAPEPAKAVHIAQSLDIPGVRGAIAPNEGYLSYHLFSPFGEERTGWTDVRHPALDGTRDIKMMRGYDWSDNQVSVLTHNVRVDPPAGVAGDSIVTDELRRQDFDVANAIYAQAGITILQENNVTIDGNDIVNNAANSPQPSLSQLFGLNRSPNDKTVNQYYVDNIPGVQGSALPPIYASRGGFANGFAIPDTSRALPNGGSSTFAHELGHFLLDDNRFPTGNTVHSSRADDVMLGKPDDPDPGAHKIQVEMFGLREPGQRVENIGTKSHLGENVTNLAGGAAITQIEAMHRSPFVQHTRDNGLTYGDRADFDWVEDNIPLELATTTGDNHPGIDFMIWQIGPIAPSLHIGHDHDDWGELNLPAFTGDTFRAIDVISQIARYADMDVDNTGSWSARESALDYLLDFSLDGTSWTRGKPITVFQDGWTFKSKAEDYVARWLSPFDAKFVRIAAEPLGGRHDGNTQIDAIIAAHITVPEPTTILGTGLAVGLGILSRKQKKTKSKD